MKLASESGRYLVVISIDAILETVYENEKIEFRPLDDNEYSNSTKNIITTMQEKI